MSNSLIFQNKLLDLPGLHSTSSRLMGANKISIVSCGKALEDRPKYDFDQSCSILSSHWTLLVVWLSNKLEDVNSDVGSKVVGVSPLRFVNNDAPCCSSSKGAGS